MFFRLLFLLTFIPFVELYFLIKLSGAIGFGNTLLVVIGTGVLGAWFLRQQGHSILMELQQQSAQGQLPSEAIAKGFFTFVGGLLLLTPGIFTDVLGLSLIFPLTQMAWKKFFMSQWERGVKSGNVQVFTSQGFGVKTSENEDPFAGQPSRRSSIDTTIIDVEVQSSETVEKKD